MDKSKPQKKNKYAIKNVTAVIQPSETYLDAIERTPGILWNYVKVGLACIGLIIAAKWLYGFLNMLINDFEGQLLVETAIQHQQIESCRDSYEDNMCETQSKLLPALADHCNEKKICMNTPVSATIKTMNNISNLIAQAFNNFADELTYPALALVCLLLFFMFKYGFKHLVSFMHIGAANES